jgi:hypothetical protein
MRLFSWLPVLVAYLCICGIIATKEDPDQDNRWKNPIVDGKNAGIVSGSVPIKFPPKRNDSPRKNSKDKKGKKKELILQGVPCQSVKI